VNRKDPSGNNVFGGGFLGLDNISIFDRSSPLPTGTDDDAKTITTTQTTTETTKTTITTNVQHSTYDKQHKTTPKTTPNTTSHFQAAHYNKQTAQPGWPSSVITCSKSASN
jgi:hypothetical protein